MLASIEATDPISIKLSNKSFDQGAAHVIAARLREFKNIQVADLSDIIAGRPEDEALKVLEIICNRYLNMPISEGFFLHVPSNLFPCMITIQLGREITGGAECKRQCHGFQRCQRLPCSLRHETVAGINLSEIFYERMYCGYISIACICY